MNRLTLAFEDPAVERVYLDDRIGRRSPRQFVASLLVTIALWLVLAITSSLLLPAPFVWAPVVIAVSSQSMAVALARFLPLAMFRRLAAGMVCVLALVAGLATASWLPSITEPVLLLTFAGAGIYLLCIHGFMDLRFLQALAVSWAVVGMYAVTLFGFTRVSTLTAEWETLWLLFAQALGMRTSYVDERLRRRIFLQQRTIEDVRRRADDLQREAARREVTLLNDELRRQIGERSRQLAEALGRIGDVSPLATSFTVGDVVKGRYRVVRPLGEGGMGTVYEVVRLSDDRRFALKVLTEATTGEAMARLAREAQVAAQLSHEHLVSIVDVDFTEAGALFLVMELVDGGSLESLRSRFGDVPWALAVLRQIAAGLRVLHDDGVVHRDLKPGNVLVAAQNGDTEGRPHVKIADFGLARITADGGPQIAEGPGKVTPPAVDPTSPALTRTGALMGTPMYMAPELARGAREATPSSDMWAFGVLAYEMLSGKPPFLVPPVREALWQRKWPAPPALDAAKVSPAVVALVERSLDARPESRPTATEWLGGIA